VCDTYQGWANRESWALHLWLTSDEVLYQRARQVVAGGGQYGPGHALREWVEQELWWKLAETDEGRAMLYDVGSLRRIDWGEVADALRA
jgi:hypothetical protein